jgi:hypothetical protein
MHAAERIRRTLVFAGVGAGLYLALFIAELERCGVDLKAEQGSPALRVRALPGWSRPRQGQTTDVHVATG